jgi:hypothetical protein
MTQNPKPTTTGTVTKTLTLAALAVLFGVSSAHAQCAAQYGCGGQVIQLGAGDFVIEGRASLPTTWYDPFEPPATEAVIWKNGQEVQRVAIEWEITEYMCCCPSEWTAFYSAPPEFDLAPGETVDVLIGTSDICINSVYVPPGTTILNLDPAPTPTSTSTRGRTTSSIRNVR